MHVCCVITPTTAPWAYASVRALRRQDPDATVHVLDPAGCWAGPPDVELLSPADIGVDARLLHEAAVLADTVPLADWLLPRLLHALVRRHGTVIHLGAGMIPVGSLRPLVEDADASGTVVVPRGTGLPPDDGLSPGPLDLQSAGPYHTALMTWGTAALDVLDDWVEQSDPGRQTPWQTAVALRAPRMQPHWSVVSRWNVDDESHVEQGPDGWTLDGRPVTAVDLTTADETRPWLLSRLDAHVARARLSAHPHLRALVARTADEITAVGPMTTGLLDRTSTGLPVLGPVRRAYRVGITASRTTGSPPPPDPFDPAEGEAFDAWLDAPAPGAAPLSRYLQALYLEREDLRRRLPLVPGPDTRRFLGWVETHARDEGGAAEHVERGLRHAHAQLDRHDADAGWRAFAARAAGLPGRPRGVNVVGYLRGELGIGEAARLSLAALRDAGVPTSTTAVDTGLQSRQRDHDDDAEGAVVRAVSLLCVNADQVGAVLESLPVLDRTTYRIGQWYWEIEEFPASQRGGLGHVDEVWVATDFVRDAIAAHTTVPVLTMPPPLPQRGQPTTLTRTDLGLPDDRPVVLFSFDYLSTLERKNPLDLVEAFRRAFAPDEGPLLVLKSLNAERRVDDAERLRLRVAGEPDVLLIEEYLAPERRDALVQLCDVYASLHRSEGLGLTMAEAMAWGRPVVATGYSGNMSFMTPENSYLVPWTPTHVPAHSEPYPQGAVWAQPDLDAAAALLREAVEDTAGAAVRGSRAARDIRELHGLTPAGERMAARLGQIESLVPRARWRARARRVTGAVGRALPGH